MEDLLIKYRKEFRLDLNIEEDENERDFLTNNQIKMERLYRRGILLNEIKNNGLEKYSSEIIDGLNEIAETVHKASEGLKIHPEKYIDYIFSTSDKSLIKGLDYIQKWKMYNDLFGDLNSK